jgi:hypothetical protein
MVFYLEARCDGLLKAIENLKKMLELPSLGEATIVGLGACFATFRTIQAAVSLCGAKLSHSRQVAIERAIKALDEELHRQPSKVCAIVTAEAESVMKTIETYLKYLPDNEPEEIAEMLYGRSTLMELDMLARNHGCSSAVEASRVATIDTQFRETAGIIARIGTPVDPFWIRCAPKEYWWWQEVRGNPQSPRGAQSEQ